LVKQRWVELKGAAGSGKTADVLARASLLLDDENRRRRFSDHKDRNAVRTVARKTLRVFRDHERVVRKIEDFRE